MGPAALRPSCSGALRHHRRWPAAVLALALPLACGLAGCGQKGPLTLPKPPAGAASAPASK